MSLSNTSEVFVHVCVNLEIKWFDENAQKPNRSTQKYTHNKSKTSPHNLKSQHDQTQGKLGTCYVCQVHHTSRRCRVAASSAAPARHFITSQVVTTHYSSPLQQMMAALEGSCTRIGNPNWSLLGVTIGCERSWNEDLLTFTYSMT